MPAVSFDLEAQLDNLRGLKDDLEEAHASPGTPSRSGLRSGIDVAISQIAQRILALEELVRRYGCDDVSLAGLTAEEARAVEKALGVLEGEFVVPEDMSAAQAWARLRGLLQAADDVLLVAARATAAAASDHDAGPRPGIVVSLARSTR